MKLIIGDCDRCGQQKKCVQFVADEFEADENYEDYESSNVCSDCIGNMLYHEEMF